MVGNKKKDYQNVFYFILYSHSQLVTGTRDPNMIAALSTHSTRTITVE
jgi:hypothetical protein